MKSSLFPEEKFQEKPLVQGYTFSALQRGADTKLSQANPFSKLNRKIRKNALTVYKHKTVGADLKFLKGGKVSGLNAAES